MSASHSYDVQAHTNSPQRSIQSNPIELHSENDDEESSELHPAVNCMVSCWRVCSWLVSIILYILEILVLIWAAYTYGNGDLYWLFGLTLAYLPLPTVVLATVSLVWYYNVDRFHRRRREREPQNVFSTTEYRKKLTVGAVSLHVLLLGMVYRYGQLIYLTILGKRTSLPQLRRDTALLRLLHSTLISAPQLVIQLYAIQLALSQTAPIFPDPLNPPILAAIGLCILSLVYAILSFTTNDRLSGKNRRVILPAHIIQSLWYLCVVASRVIALAIFAYSHGYWVYAVVGAHWVLMFLFLVIQKTSFCADIEIQPSQQQQQDGGGASPQQTIKRRWSLEIPFYLVAATVYIFTFFNMKHGKTWYLLTPFHLLMFAENVAMGVLFYIEFSGLMYAQAALTVVAGLYPVGMFFMVIYYCLCHPRRTEDWYWVGIPRRISCTTYCCCCCSSKKQGEDAIGFRNRTSVVISGPTLVSHNGFLPDNMIPAGVPRSPLPEGIGEAVDSNMTHQRSGMGTDRVAERLTQRQQPRNQISSLAIVSPDSANENVNNYPGVRSVTTPSESNRSNPVFSDVPSQFLASELDTDIDSNVMRTEGENIDTVIDTPLAGFTPEPFDLNAVHMLQRGGRMKSVESQKADTVDTGIDMESDIGLTPGTTNAGRPEDVGQHQFLDIPAKRKNYMSERSKLEQHYFPEEERHHHQRTNRDSGSVTPTLPTPNWSQSPASTSPHSGRITWGQHTSDSSPERLRRNVTPGTISSESQQSPKRSNNVPRSPKGARAFTINQQESGYHSDHQSYQQNSESRSGYPIASGYERRQMAPRSPKGARRLIINSTSSTSSGPLSAQYHQHHHHQQQRQPPPVSHQSLPGHTSERQSASFHQSPHRSPARLPRGAQGYPLSSPERTANSINRAGGGGGGGEREGVGMLPPLPPPPPHIMMPPEQFGPTTASNQGYPAHRSPARLPRGVPGYENQRMDNSTHQDNGGGGRGGDDSQWDSWTAQNTHINAAQAAASTHLRVEGGAMGGAGGAGGGQGGLLHKEMSPSSKSENAADVERNRSFKVARRAQNVNPYYSPYTPKRQNTDEQQPPNSSNYPQLRRAPGSNATIQMRQSSYQPPPYPRYSGEYNPRFSAELDANYNRSHIPTGQSQGRMSESYPSPLATTRNNGGVGQMSPRYPRTPQGAAAAASARAPRMVRSPPEKRLKSMSPQRSLVSYGGGGWPMMEGGTGSMTGSASRPSSLHSNSAFTPQLRHLSHHHHQLQAAARHSDGASAMAWASANVQWSGRRSPRNPVLHVPRSSAHESAV